MPHYRRWTLLGLSLCVVALIGDTTAQLRDSAISPPPFRVPPATSPTDLVDVRNQIDGEIEIILRRTKLLLPRLDVLRVAVGDSSIADVAQIDVRELQLIGKEMGTTTLTLWLGDQAQPPQIVTYLVTVTPDPGLHQLRKTQYQELEQMVNELFPNSRVKLIPIADKLVVRGQARDAQEAAQIMGVIRGQAVDVSGAPGQRTDVVNQGQAATVYPGTNMPPSHIINMLRVPGEQQVMLKVRVAELSRTALRELGVDLTIGDGQTFFSSILAGRSNIIATFEDGDIQTLLHALETNGSLKVLAEPNLVTLSGHTASFIAGGRFAVPTVVGVGGAEAATTTFQGFGTQLTFTPTLLDKDRIRLTVAPEFSSVNADLTVNGIPGLNTRAAFTTVEMREGQVLAIAGLLSDRQVGTTSRVPLLGRLPVFRTVFSSKSVTRDETELIVLVTPELVHPLDPDEVPYVLPGSEVTEPRDRDLYIRGRIEGNPGENFRSTVWPEHRARVLDARQRANKHGWVAHPAGPAVDIASHGGAHAHASVAPAAVEHNVPTPQLTGQVAPHPGVATQWAGARRDVRRSPEDSAVLQTGFRPISTMHNSDADESRYLNGPGGFSE